MKEWFIFSLLCLVLWGIWGFLPKLSTKYIDPKSVLVFSSIGSFLVLVVVLASIGFKPEIHPKGILFAILGGLSGSIGLLFFYLALNRGKASLVVTITGLYPLIAILLCFLLLKEALTIKNAIGIIFALIAMALLVT